MANPFSLEGKNAWITGASYGIGFNIAKAFVAAGIKTIIFNDINEAALERGLNNYVQILYRSYSRKEELWRLSLLFCCLQGTKTLNNLKNTFISIIFE